MRKLWTVVELIVAGVVMGLIDIMCLYSAWNSDEPFSRVFWVVFTIFVLYLYYELFVKWVIKKGYF